MFEKTILDNGLRLITEKLEGTKAVTVLVLAGAGSRYEHQEIRGISHFLEHMFFKGADRYKNTKEVSEAIDSVGGEFNAFTGKEYAASWTPLFFIAQSASFCSSPSSSSRRVNPTRRRIRVFYWFSK